MATAAPRMSDEMADAYADEQHRQSLADHKQRQRAVATEYAVEAFRDAVASGDPRAALQSHDGSTQPLLEYLESLSPASAMWLAKVLHASMANDDETAIRLLRDLTTALSSDYSDDCWEAHL